MSLKCKRFKSNAKCKCEYINPIRYWLIPEKKNPYQKQNTARAFVTYYIIYNHTISTIRCHGNQELRNYKAFSHCHYKLLCNETDMRVTYRHLRHRSHGTVQIRQMAARVETKWHRDDKWGVCKLPYCECMLGEHWEFSKFQTAHGLILRARPLKWTRCSLLIGWDMWDSHISDQ